MFKVIKLHWGNDTPIYLNIDNIGGFRQVDEGFQAGNPNVESFIWSICDEDDQAQYVKETVEEILALVESEASNFQGAVTIKKRINPDWKDDIPFCTATCQEFRIGKGFKILGYQPASDICLPIVKEIGAQFR